MKKLTALLTGLVLSALPVSSALASGLDFSFAGSDFSATGNFTYTTTGTTDVFTGNTITGTATIGKSTVNIDSMAPFMTFLGNDNLVYTGTAAADLNGGRPFDFQGFAFILSNGDAITLFSDGGKDMEILGVYATGQQIVTDTAAINVGSVPEPGSLALLGTGALGALGVVRRRLAA